MSKPTVEEANNKVIFEISEIIEGYSASDDNIPSYQCARAIFDHLMALKMESTPPPRKPLSKLADNEGDCRLIFNFITDGYDEDTLFDESIDFFDSKGEFQFISLKSTRNGKSHIQISPDGEISHTRGNKQVSLNPFLVSDFIRSIGYDVINPTETVEKS